MYPLAVTTLFATVIAFFAAVMVPVQEAQHLALKADVATLNFMDYRLAVIRYMNANQTATGAITDTALATYMSRGHVRNSNWTNYIDPTTRQLYVYTNPPSAAVAGMANSLYKRSGGSMFVGINSSGVISSPYGGGGSVTVPSVVPTGAIVIAGR